MKRKIRLKKRGRIKINKLTISIILVIIFLLLWFFIFNKELLPILSNYALVETKNISTKIINEAVTKKIAKEEYLNDLVETTLNKNGEIVSVDFNPVYVNKALSTITNEVQNNIKKIEEGNVDFDSEIIKNNNDLIFEIPFGIVFRMPILADLGPKLPLKTKIIGNVISNINTKITNYGINNAMLEIYIEVEVSEQILLPFISKKTTVKENIPVAMKVIQGTVPKYYGGSMNNNSSMFSIPIENEK